MRRALLLVARSIALAHAHWRTTLSRRRPLSVEVDRLQEKVERLRTENELLRTRLRRLPPHHRPRYRPWERFRILWHQARHGLSLRSTARSFVLSAQTLVNWHREVETGPVRLVHGRHPLNRLPDLVADLAVRLKREWPAWGTRRIAAVLARLGLRASRSSVQRTLRRPRRHPAVRALRRSARGPLVAQRPNHVWMIDFTRLRGILRPVFVGAVLDAFSRKVLAIRVVLGAPTARFAAGLLRGEQSREVGVHAASGRVLWA